MKRALLALTLGGSAAFTPGAAHAQAESVRDACLTTEMRREAFEHLADERNWTPLQIRIDDPLQATTWHVAYGDSASGDQFWMSGRTEGDDPSRATLCRVFSPGPPEGWRTGLERLALEQGMSPTPAEADSRALESRAWTRQAPMPLSLSYDLHPSVLTVRVSRPTAAQIE